MIYIIAFVLIVLIVLILIAFVYLFCCCSDCDYEQIETELEKERRDSLMLLQSIQKRIETKVRTNDPARLPDAGINPEEKEEATAEAKDDFFTLNSHRFD